MPSTNLGFSQTAFPNCTGLTLARLQRKVHMNGFSFFKQLTFGVMCINILQGVKLAVTSCAQKSDLRDGKKCVFFSFENGEKTSKPSN